MNQEHSSIEAFPESLELIEEDSALKIAWDDGYRNLIKLDEFARGVFVRDVSGHHPSQSLNLKPDQFPGIRIADLAPVGRYAYHIVWSDGHDTGIYTLKMLRGAGREIAE